MKHPFQRSFAALTAVLPVLSAVPAQADMLSGGLLAAVTRGEPFTGPRFVDLIVVGLAVYFLFRLFSRRGRQSNDASDYPRPGQPIEPKEPRPEASNQPSPRSNPNLPENRPPNPEQPAGEHPQEQAYRAARATWDYLRSDPGAAPTPPRTAPAAGTAPPSGGDFLDGAKAAYARIRPSLEKGDPQDVAPLLTPELLADLKTRPAPAQNGLDILLVEAAETGRRAEAGKTLVDVSYKTLAKRRDGQNVELKETWTFCRDENDPNSTWRLAGMR